MLQNKEQHLPCLLELQMRGEKFKVCENVPQIVPCLSLHSGRSELLLLLPPKQKITPDC